MSPFYEHVAERLAVTPGLPTLSSRDIELIDLILHQERDNFRGGNRAAPEPATCCAYGAR